MLLFVTLAAAAPWSTALDDLDPPFRKQVDALLAALSTRGFTPVVTNTWRDPRIQDLLVLGGHASQARGGESCHNHLGIDGAPAARAVDVWSRPLDLALLAGSPERLAEEVPLLRALGEEATRLGLRWGGTWHGHPSPWDTWGLGWDPAHVEVGRCRR